MHARRGVWGVWGVCLLALRLGQRGTLACSDDVPKASVRFNVASDRLYLEGSGCITPSDIYAEKQSTNSLIPIKAVTKTGATATNETG